jgi:2'-5' RNA ligase
VDPVGIHLTLKFLGNVNVGKVSPITEAIARAAQGVSPFRLELGGLGAFPNLRRPRVIWVAVKGDVERVASLQKGIDRLLIPLGFAPESRSFTAHLTLGRLRDRASGVEQQSIGETVMSAKVEEVPFQAGEISLMRSTLTPSGAIYSRLSSVSLEGG